MENLAKSEKKYIAEYQQKGYTANFRIKEGSMHLNDENLYKPDDVFIVAQHRFEGMSNPADLSILYVIETVDKKKGTLLAAYGPTGNLDAAEFFKEVPEENISDKEKI